MIASRAGAERGASAPLVLRSTVAVAGGALSGLLYAATLPPFNAAALAWIALIPLFVVTQRGRLRDALAAAYAAGLVITSQVAYGLFPYDRRAWLAAMLIVPGWIVLPIAMLRGARLERPASVRPFIAAAVWVAVETIVQDVFHLPLDSGLTQAHSLAVLQVAALAGSAGIAYLVVLSGVLGARVVALLWDRRWKPAATVALLAALVPGLTVTAGTWVLHTAEPGPCLASADVIQPVISFDTGQRSWTDPQVRAAVRARFRQSVQQARAPLVFWPEGAGAFESFRIAPTRHRLTAQAKRRRQHLFISAVDFDEQGRKFNSLFAFTPDRPMVKYDKTITVPGAEADVTPGSRAGLIATDYGDVGVLICFESCFPAMARDLTARGATLLAVSTSDVAFGPASLAHLHLSTSIVRAVENRRGVVHAANGGPSAFIDPHGRITAQTSLFVPAVLQGCVAAPGKSSLYTRGGYLFRSGCVLVGAGVLLALLRTRRARSRRERSPLRSVALPVVCCALATLPLTVVNARVTSWAGGVSSADGELAHSIAPAPRAMASTALRQTAPNTCGPTALAYLASYFGLSVDAQQLAAHMPLTPTGVSMADLATAAGQVGLVAQGVQENLAALRLEPQPVIVHLQPLHFAVLLSIDSDQVILFDPSAGIVSTPTRQFETLWSGKVLRIRPPQISM